MLTVVEYEQRRALGQVSAEDVLGADLVLGDGGGGGRGSGGGGVLGGGVGELFDAVRWW
mgnify:CR=1 FL=1